MGKPIYFREKHILYIWFLNQLQRIQLNTAADKWDCKMYSCKDMQVSVHWPLHKIKHQDFSYINSVCKSGAEELLIVRKRIKLLLLLQYLRLKKKTKNPNILYQVLCRLLQLNTHALTV